MDDDQQFCLRWNNHQSTLVAVFDTLLENGTLVDCTLAAEGKCLNAHKVVLSACSPYFEALLSRHFDKHPILILKDVKFQELKAMMDYMYRGEVNISQDQLGALLKAAESLQIKGLSDNRKGETERKPAPAPPPPKSPQPTSALPKVQGLTIEQRNREDSREGSQSPGPRKKKRMRRKSEDMDNHDASNSSESHSLPAQNIPSSLPAVSKINADVPEPIETKSEMLTRLKQDEMPQVPIIKEKLETHSELMLEPKSEYIEEMNEDSIEDLTLDDDDLSNMEQMDDGAGPSHGSMGEGSSNQGFGGWHMGNQSQDEVFLAAQEAVGAHRDSQEVMETTLIADNLELQEALVGDNNGWTIQVIYPNESTRLLRNGALLSLDNMDIANAGLENLENINNADISESKVHTNGAIAADLTLEDSLMPLENMGVADGKPINANHGTENEIKRKRSLSQPFVIEGRLISLENIDIDNDETINVNEVYSNKNKISVREPADTPLIIEGRFFPLENIDLTNGEENNMDINEHIYNCRSKIKKPANDNLPYADCWTSSGYVCPKCRKIYNARKNLARHINIECGKDPQYSCKYCDYKNYRRNEIKKHIAKKHVQSAP